MVKMGELSLYDGWINTWRFNVFKYVIFVAFGFMVALIVISISRVENIQSPVNIFDVIPDISSMSSGITIVVLTINSIFIGFSSVSIFNFIEWSDSLLRNGNLSNEDTESIHTLRRDFSRFIRSYIMWSFLTILLQIIIYIYSYISNLFSIFLLGYNSISLIVVFEGFRIILDIVLMRIVLNI